MNCCHGLLIFVKESCFFFFLIHSGMIRYPIGRRLSSGCSNRPVRVCGMVKNEGEPGGGPFWVKEDDTQSLQIVEQTQLDLHSKEQKDIWKSSTHFNPVDHSMWCQDLREKNLT